MIYNNITDHLGKPKFNSSLKNLFNFFKKQDILSDNDINCLKAYNAEIEHGVAPMAAYYRTMQTASDTSVNMSSAAGNATVNLEQIPKVSKAAVAGIKAIAIAGNMILFAAISKSIDIAAQAINKYVHAAEIARIKSSELTDSWVSENSSINESISKYIELKNRINDASISSFETKSIKKDLLEVQKNLVDKYGQEALGIDLVNGKYDEQIAKLNKLSKQKAKEYVSENYSNIQDDKKYLSDKIKLNKNLGIQVSFLEQDSINKYGFDLDKYMKRYNKLDTEITTQSQFGVSGNLHLITNGTREEVYKQLTQLFNDLSNDFGESNKDVNTFKTTLSNIIQNSFDTKQIEKSKNNIKKYAEAQILSNNDTRKLYEDATLAVDEYNEALSSGVGVEEAKKNFKVHP